ncbi:hypothetical protein ABK040_009941 [Willaertia magna]
MSSSNKTLTYYEILNIEKTSTKDEIKKAYKKQALIWHPDRNLNNQEEATNKFKQIQDAYETLMDDNERAWYDDHMYMMTTKNNISSKNEDQLFNEPEQVNLFNYLSSNCYTTFNTKDKNNFYSIFENLFITILKEEELYSNHKTYTKPTNIPKFGNETTNIELVIQFYQFWNKFTTKRTFAWKDKWKLSEAPNSYIRRNMEKENEEERKSAKKEYNETLKHVLKKMKSKDPRILKEIERKKKLEEEELLKKEEERKKVEEFKRKYHLEKEKLKKQLEEEVMIGDNDDLDDDDVEVDEEFNEMQDALDEVEDLFDNLYFNNKKKNVSDEEEEEEEENKENVNKEEENNEKEQEELQKEEKQEEEEIKEKKKNKKQLEKKNKQQKQSSENTKKEKEEIIILNEEESKQQQQQEEEEQKNEEEEDSVVNNTTTKEKKKRRRADKNNKKENEKKESLKCNVCGEEFPTRNSLFTHIKQKGHALHK